MTDKSYSSDQRGDPQYKCSLHGTWYPGNGCCPHCPGGSMAPRRVDPGSIEDYAALRRGIKLLKESLQEVSHTSKILCHENESLKRELEQATDLIHKMQINETIRLDPRKGFQWWWDTHQCWVSYAHCRTYGECVWNIEDEHRHRYPLDKPDKGDFEDLDDDDFDRSDYMP